MYKITLFILMTILCLTQLTNATKYYNCKNGCKIAIRIACFLIVLTDSMTQSYLNDITKNNTLTVDISGCKKPPCELKRGTHTILQETFKPHRNIQQLKTSVHAIILGLPIPFIGVDNANASGDIYTLDGEKADWPLKAGTEYQYKNSFKVERNYPTLAPIVHWALKDGNEVITCFEINTKIV